MMNMNLPINFDDITLWLVVTSFVMVITAEVIVETYEHNELVLNRKRLNVVVQICTILTVFVVVTYLMFII
jgi:hypothetical protein